MRTLNSKNGEIRILRNGKWVKLPPKQPFTLAEAISQLTIEHKETARKLFPVLQHIRD